MAPAEALDTAQFLSQYSHTAWRTKDGELPAPAFPIAQTSDGYLWIGTQQGLLRFDGVRFVPFSQPGGKALQSPFIVSLVGSRDGALWIGTTRGLSRWKNQELTAFPIGPQTDSNIPADDSQVAEKIVEDKDGGIWFARPRSNNQKDARPSICKVIDEGIRCYGKEDGLDFAPNECCVGSLSQLADGSFLITTNVSVIRWTPGTIGTTIIDEPKVRAGSLGMISAAEWAGRGLWFGVDDRGPGLGLQQLEDGVLKSSAAPFDGSTVAVQVLFVDRENALWIGTLDQGIYRIYGDRVENFRTSDGLSGDAVYWFYEDREGNVWVSTSQGIDRFRGLKIYSFSKREGLGTDEADGVLATREGKLWIGCADALTILSDDSVSTIRASDGLPGNQLTSMFEDHFGAMWIGVDQALYVYENGKFNTVNSREGSPVGMVGSITEDKENNIWARVKGKLLRIEKRQVREEVPLAGALAADPHSGIWIGSSKGLTRYRNGGTETFSYGDQVGRVRQLLVKSDGSILGASEAGVIGWKDGQQRRLTKDNGLPCGTIHALNEDRNNGLWLYASCGLLLITSADWTSWWEHPETRVHPRTFDVLDGARTNAAPFNGSARTPDGRLWFANGAVVQMIDPSKLDEAAGPPPVHVEELIADRIHYSAYQKIVVPPNPREIEIDYTALNLAVPKRVRFRYRLEGLDKQWQEPAQRRQAYFTDLAPGDYRFQVMATNDETSWIGEGASVDFKVAAAWYQTTWFRLLCLILGVLSVVSIYRLRVEQIARSMRRRFDERLAERTRLARELHDTLLQTIQGSKMVADDALDDSTDPIRIREAMKRLSVWLGQAIQEGRDALNSLRTSTTQTNDLAEGLKRATEECVSGRTMTVAFSVSGETREMHPIARDEVYRIGYEAIRNAGMHSEARHLDVTLDYSDDLTLRIRDDGRGFDAEIDRKEGHFGLQGMRERAMRIEATLTILSAPTAGSDIRLIVPGRAIYRNARTPPATLGARMRRALRSSSRSGNLD